MKGSEGREGLVFAGSQATTLHKSVAGDAKLGGREAGTERTAVVVVNGWGMSSESAGAFGQLP
jgi:hypothetical protein